MSRWDSEIDRESRENKWVDVWIDGSCPGNGLYVDYGGIGIFWADKHPWNVSERATGRTNDSCAIEAAIWAIQIAKENFVEKLRINSSSEFLIHSALDWILAWKCNRWKTPDGKDVKYKNELKALDNEMDKRYIRIFWNLQKFDPDHVDRYGIDMAEKLARKGARN